MTSRASAPSCCRACAYEIVASIDHRDETGAVEAFNSKWNNGMAAFVLTQRRRAYGMDAAVRDVEVEYA